MSFEVVDREIQQWDDSHLTRLINRAVELRRKFRQVEIDALTAKLDDPARWVALEEVERTLAEDDRRREQ